MGKKGVKEHRQQESNEIEDLLKELEDPYTNKDLVELSKVLDSKTKDPTQIYPINANYDEITRSLSGINLLFGSAYTGRKSSVYYGNRNTMHPIIEIDANIYST